MMALLMALLMWLLSFWFAPVGTDVPGGTIYNVAPLGYVPHCVTEDLSVTYQSCRQYAGDDDTGD